MTFNTHKFIREVEIRKAIWDFSSEEYDDREEKQRCWEELADIMSEEELTEHEKRELVVALQKKWKNVRTSYCRELRRRNCADSGLAVTRKTPYVYFDLLQFLKTDSDLVEIEIGESNFEDSAFQNETPVSKKKHRRERKVVTENLKKRNDSVHMYEVLSKSISAREELERRQEADPDRLFLLSLLEDFKNIPKRNKLSSKMEIINAIKKAQVSSEVLENNSKNPEMDTS